MKELKWIGPYQLIDLIDRPGRTAEVHRARHEESGKEVAIKILHEYIPNREPKIQEKFLDQVKIVSALDHPHIIKVIDVQFMDTQLGQGTRPCIVMPYAPGGTLRKLLNNEALLPLETIRSYVQQLADALSYAHDHNVIHCDVKPENILLDKDASNLFLTDFGIARIRAETFSSTSMTTQSPSGTDVYMAPEQFRGKWYRRTDQYALALTVYECLCGHPPFGGKNYEELREQHLHVKVPSLRSACKTRGREISKKTEQVILKALAKDWRDRYSDIRDFASELDKALMLEIEPRSLIRYDNAGATGLGIGMLVGIGMLGVYLTARVDVPQQFPLWQTILSHFLELLYALSVLVGLGYVLAYLIARKAGHSITALGLFILAILSFFIQYFSSRPLFTLAGQLQLLGFFALIPAGAVIGFLLAWGIGCLVIWIVNKRREPRLLNQSA